MQSAFMEDIAIQKGVKTLEGIMCTAKESSSESPPS